MEYTVAVEQDAAGFFVGRVLELPGCFTQASSEEAVLHQMTDAIHCHLEAGAEPVRLAGIHTVAA